MASPPTALPRESTAADIVHEAWAAVTELDHFDPDDDFFALGGDSVSAALVARKVGVAAEVHVPARALFEHPTFESFTAFVDRRRRLAEPTISPRPDPVEHPMAPGQERLWLLHQLHPDRATYVVPTIMEMVGILDRDALAAAIDALTTRHEPLRTTVHDDGAAAVCRVGDPAPVRIEAEPVTDEDHARARVTEFLGRPMSLANEPPMRVKLLRLSATRHWLIFAIHHIATDGESERILLDELGRLYNAGTAGAATPLAPLSVGYGDIAAWRAGRAAEAVAAGRDRRREEFRGCLDRPLALEGPDPDHAVGAGSRHTRWLGRPLAESIRVCASSRRTTVFVTLLSAFADIAARWTGADDVCIGYPVSVREPAPARDLVGFFVDTGVIRIDVSGRPSFGSVVDRVHAAVVGAAADPVPFDVLAEAVAADRGDRRPLFRTWFNHLGEATRASAMAGLTTRLLDVPVPPALFDLNVYIVEEDGDIRVDVVGDVAVCSAAAAEELLDQYVGLLATAIPNVDEPLRPQRARTTRSVALPDPGDPLVTGAAPTLVRRLAGVVSARATSTAVRDAHGDITYARLRTAVADLAGALPAAGVGPGDPVAVFARRDADLVTAMLAVWAAGCRLLLLDPEYPAARLAGYLASAGARCLVTGAPVPELRTPAFIRLHDGRASVGRVAEPNEARVAAGPGYVAFTSGSTGVPVGVTSGLEPIEHFLHWYSRENDLGSEDRFALLAGLSHDPVFRDVLLPLWSGATLCIPDPQTYRVPSDLIRWLRDQQITVVNLTPPLARLLVDEEVTLPAMRLICLGGDVSTTADVERLAAMAPRATLLNGYGTTETPQLVSRNRLVPGRPPTLGAQVPGSQLLVVDPAGDVCGVGEAGRIVVRSRHLATVLASERSGESYDDPVPGVGRFVTGDLGRYHTDGTIAYLGRDDDIVNVRGFRVHPAETDRALAGDPRVTASVTVPWTGPDGPELISYVVGAHVTPAEITSRLASVLPGYLVPTTIVLVDRLPLSANGKIDRAALAAPRPRRPVGRPRTSANGSVETRLAEILSGILGTDPVDVDATFFELGGTSLHLLRLHSAIRREIDQTLPLLALYESPSIRALAQRLTDRTPPPAVVTVAAGHGRGSRADERARRLAARQLPNVRPRLPEQR